MNTEDLMAFQVWLWDAIRFLLIHVLPLAALVDLTAAIILIFVFGKKHLSGWHVRAYRAIMRLSGREIPEREEAPNGRKVRGGR